MHVRDDKYGDRMNMKKIAKGISSFTVATLILRRVREYGTL